MKELAWVLAAGLVLSGNGWAAIKTETVEYKHDKTVCEGYLAYDDASKEKRPGVLVVHEWMGLGPYAKRRAEQLAGLGYVAFAVDMYGKGVRAKDIQEASKLAGIYKGDRKLMRARVNAGLDILRKQAFVDTKRIAAIGYCFGGTTVLELARGGADIAGVASFHGGLDTPTPEDAKNIKCKVLALHGGDDPYVPMQQLLAFEDEMRKGNVDWQVAVYSSAVHSFTNPDSGNDNSKGAAYNEKADKRSWEALKVFFAEIFR
jgi:dienelactone hydrolase